MRLKAAVIGIIQAVRAAFQSHCGAIKSFPYVRFRFPRGFGFNPTVVRLKAFIGAHDTTPLSSCFNPTVVRLKGAARRRASRAGVEFQSHCGAIKRRLSRFELIYRNIGFNPTVVRLKDFTTQSPNIRMTCFNPTVVRLKGASRSPADGKRLLVSIPLWCD